MIISVSLILSSLFTFQSALAGGANVTSCTLPEGVSIALSNGDKLINIDLIKSFSCK